MSKITILVLDDQPQWRTVLSTILKEEGYRVIEAITVESAKLLIEKNDISLATLDLRLVDEESYNVEGLDVLHTIKSKNPNIKCILVTGYKDAVRNSKILKKYDAVFKKPLNKISFIKKVKELLSN